MPGTVCGKHVDYQAKVDAYLAQYPRLTSYLSKKVRDFITKAYNCDLTPIAWMLEERYRGRGRPARDPLCVLRSCLLSLECGVASITEWVSTLHLVPVLAVASGFDPDDVPSVGTFYDFFKRVCPSQDGNLSPRIHAPKKTKVVQPARKGEKAESIEKETCADLYAHFEQNDPQDMLFAQLLVALYDVGFLQRSVELGVIPQNGALAMAGDGTAVRTAARERSKPTCDCRAKGVMDCTCSRIYSQPDTDYGWDSNSRCYYCGYNLYGITVAGLDHDLPLFAQLHPASRHDSKALVRTQANMDCLLDFDAMGIRIGSILLDSAHDANAIYEHYDGLGIKTFIDLNERHGSPVPKTLRSTKTGGPCARGNSKCVVTLRESAKQTEVAVSIHGKNRWCAALQLPGTLF